MLSETKEHYIQYLELEVIAERGKIDLGFRLIVLMFVLPTFCWRKTSLLAISISKPAIDA
jgi:hypothetical protein